MMRRAGMPGFLILLSVAGTASAQVAEDRHAAELDRYIETARETWQVPGVAVAVVRGDEVVCARGFGLLRADGPDPVDEHSLFVIGSSSKAVTAAALGILVDEGRIRWDDPVVDHLAHFRLPSPYLTTQITIRDLIAHRTGAQPAGLLWMERAGSAAELEPDRVHVFRAFWRSPGLASVLGRTEIRYLNTTAERGER